MAQTKTIAIAGAGSIGGYVGGLLSLGGHEVRMLARPAMVARVAAGLHLSSHEGLDATVLPGQLQVSEDSAILRGADIILVTVKSGGTAGMAELIAAEAPQGAVVISLQNGVGNADILRAGLPGRDVRAGMVPFNVLQTEDGRLHRGTSGDIMIEAGPGGISEALSVPYLPVHESTDMGSVLWGKLLLNLNNALNALSGLTLYQQLSDRDWRRLVAGQMDEALRVLAAAGIIPAKATPLPPKMVPKILRLPTPVFRIVSGRMLKIDRMARSSMWEDLSRGRPTEIGVLQGAVEDLATRHGLTVPLISRVAELIRVAEANGAGSPGLSPDDVRG
ncbi:2-dehydropantoate 2-reductase [Parvularcula marina]|uniref:2-dehydropantoate 2-reductase n=1 Tax=Parvularcula marina TaxID=2292771 RepID=A0A371RJR7_9PROT|nr:2-dehydropantoate 2-reductase [Parvularcula marina]RFB05691.1 2-dehydropantoate 2-reductase [Parvularcula marina]